MTLRFLTFVTAAAIGTVAHAQTAHLQPGAPRTVVTADASAPPVVRAGLLQSTLIELPAEEKVATVFGGDTVSREYEPKKIDKKQTEKKTIWEIRVNSILKLDRAAKASREEQEQDDAPLEEAAA